MMGKRQLTGHAGGCWYTPRPRHAHRAVPSRTAARALAPPQHRPPHETHCSDHSEVILRATLRRTAPVPVCREPPACRRTGRAPASLSRAARLASAPTARHNIVSRHIGGLRAPGAPAAPVSAAGSRARARGAPRPATRCKRPAVWPAETRMPARSTRPAQVKLHLFMLALLPRDTRDLVLCRPSADIAAIAFFAHALPHCAAPGALRCWLR